MNATKGKRQYVKNKKGYYEFECNFCNKLFVARGDYNPLSCGCQTNIYSIREHEIKHVTLLEKIKNGKTKVKVQCNNCDNIYYVFPQVLFRENIKYCKKCKHTSLIKMNNGLRNHNAYNVLDGMKQRCYNKNSQAYEYYGAKNVTICNEWLGNTGYINFCNWADNNGFNKNLTIDRIDPYGNYEPDNCRWITKQKQRENKRIQSNNKSGYRGVYLSKKINKYESSITYNKKKKTIGYFINKEQAAIARYYYAKLNDIVLTHDLPQYDMDIINWGLDRNLINMNIDKEIKIFQEELEELYEATKVNDIHEIIDAFNDMHVVMTQTLGKAGLIKLDINDNEKLKNFFTIYKSIEQSIKDYGYNFKLTIQETIKEISSRQQDPEQKEYWKHDGNNGEKWMKWKNQPKNTLYKANFSKAKL